MSQFIPLVGPRGVGRSALVDDGDFQLVEPFHWSLLVPNPNCPHGTYAQAWIKGQDGIKRRTTLHRFLLNAQPGQVIDHINGDGLDNRRCNLRLVTREQNQRNRRARNGKSYKGITHTPSGLWRARIELEGVSRHLGAFETPEAASLAYHRACVKFFGAYTFGAALSAPEMNMGTGG